MFNFIPTNHVKNGVTFDYMVSNNTVLFMVNINIYNPFIQIRNT